MLILNLDSTQHRGNDLPILLLHMLGIQQMLRNPSYVTAGNAYGIKGMAKNKLTPFFLNVNNEVLCRKLKSIYYFKYFFLSQYIHTPIQ